MQSLISIKANRPPWLVFATAHSEDPSDVDSSIEQKVLWYLRFLTKHTNLYKAS